MELTNTQKKQIIENELMNYHSSVYQLELRGRAAKIVGNAEVEKNILAEIEKHLKIIDFLEKELKEK